MRAAYQSFQTGQPPEAILKAISLDNGGHDSFYARLYVGLWHEAHGEADKVCLLKFVLHDA